MKSYPTKFKSFLWKIDRMGTLQKLPNSIQTLYHTYNFLACLPNPYKLSILGDICRATILLFFLLQILLFVVETLKYGWSFIWIS